jgi:hypothetical protein
MSGTADEDDALDELGAVADELLEQAAALRRRWEELGDVLGVDLAPTAFEGDTGVMPVRRQAGALFDDVGEVDVAMPTDFGERSPDPVRVMAFDLMLSGRSRKEVKEYVRSSFGSDADLTIVDELFDAH